MEDITRSLVDHHREAEEIGNPGSQRRATAAKKEYASAINHWEDKNDRDRYVGQSKESIRSVESYYSTPGC